MSLFLTHTVRKWIFRNFFNITDQMNPKLTRCKAQIKTNSFHNFLIEANLEMLLQAGAMESKI